MFTRLLFQGRAPAPGTTPRHGAPRVAAVAYDDSTAEVETTALEKVGATSVEIVAMKPGRYLERYQALA